jgi:hypothetical protein
MPDYPNHPARVGRMQSLASICGRDTDGHARRPTLTGNYQEPHLPWADRKHWLRKVNELAAECSAKHESYPHKVTAVARALAFAGDVCKPSIEYLASRAGCVENTVKACLAWLEERGALTWSNTARRHRSGRMVRSSNLYRFILDFSGGSAMLVRAMRAVWRERKVVAVSKGNGCPGVSSLHINPDAYSAMHRLADIAQQRSEQFNQQWLAARTV